MAAPMRTALTATRSMLARPTRQTLGSISTFAQSRPHLSLSSTRPPALRSFSSTPLPQHGGKGRPKPGEGITLHFKKPNGEIVTCEANEGDDIVDVSWEYDLDIEAACEKSVACSTCHVILEDDVYDKLEEPDDDENDMLDLAFGLTDTSRLGCQVKVTKDMQGTTITLPSATRNLRVDGSKPTPH
ncbi:ferredoxin family 2Fe-2S iron-sulfur cluster binding protein [Sporobolomyces salmoneus]|uniref:ferredoxin family 2Fe-2S iron-sulfur cluster binding protein n=1 Tax=Sporobolomyces salmoneus TaxID=183962 RepID=UPI003178841A